MSHHCSILEFCEVDSLICLDPLYPPCRHMSCSCTMVGARKLWALAVLLALISGGLGLQRLEAGSQFHSQRGKSGHSSESTESWPPDHEGQWPGTRPCLVCFGEINLSREMRSSETSQGFIRRKKSTCEQTPMGGLRVMPSW